MKTVDYVIVGAGVAGITLRKFLHDRSAVLLDPSPGGYKIGESIIPEHNHHPVMRALMPAIRELKSYTPKLGSTFVSKDSIACFPLPSNLANIAMHIERAELETMMLREWSIRVARERALAMDLDARTVTTDQGTYQFRKQLIDCSGPSRFALHRLDDVHEIRPADAIWAYWDIVEDKRLDAASLAKATGKPITQYDATEARLMGGEFPKGWSPSCTTTLTMVEDGVWTWQIPLFRGTIMSFGVVSRHGMPSEDEYEARVAESTLPGIVLRKRSRTGSSVYDRWHKRARFAQTGSVASTDKLILVSDAFAFADPIYSVGTGLAVNKAIQVAEMLNDGGWSAAKSTFYNEQYQRLLKVAVGGFDYWYSGALVSDDYVARTVQTQLLQGECFGDEIAAWYQSQIRLAMGDPESEAHHGFPDLDGVAR